MAKWTFTDAVSTGDLPIEDIDQARVLDVRVDFQRNTVSAIIAYGTKSGGIFRPAPVVPSNAIQVVADVTQWPDVAQKWKQFQRKLLKQIGDLNQLPPGQDED